jgi:plasmid stability protein
VACAPSNTEVTIASITIRNLDDAVKRRLRVRATEKGRSMEEEAREIERQALDPPSAPGNLGQSIHARFAGFGWTGVTKEQRGPRKVTPAFS